MKTCFKSSGEVCGRLPDVRAEGAPAAFTLLELLTVIAIIGILAAITIPNLNSFKPNVMAGGSRQLLDDVARARQLAISQRTTVYMIFVPTNFVSDGLYAQLATAEKEEALALLDKQMIGYTFVSLRKLGSQPGVRTPTYLSEWRTLPNGVIIAGDKFGFTNPATYRSITNNGGDIRKFVGFSRTRDDGVDLPFPCAEGANLNIPYIAFNYLGQLISGRDENIPLALGSVGFGRDANRRVTTALVKPMETPADNSVNAYNLVHIDWLTGRARLERQEIR